MKIETEVGAVRITYRFCHVEKTAVYENSLPLIQPVTVLAHSDFDRAGGYDAKLQFLVPVPVGKAKNIAAHDGMIDCHRKFKRSVKGCFPVVTVNGNVVNLHLSTSILLYFLSVL